MAALHHTGLTYSFYHVMHYIAKRGIAITCRLSVCPSVTDRHRLKILETNCTSS